MAGGVYGVLQRALLDGRGRGRAGGHDHRVEHRAAAEGLVDEVSQARHGRVKIRHDSLADRPDDADALDGPLEHAAGLEAEGQRPAVRLAIGHHGRLADDDAALLDRDVQIGCADINGQLISPGQVHSCSRHSV